MRKFLRVGVHTFFVSACLTFLSGSTLSAGDVCRPGEFGCEGPAESPSGRDSSRSDTGSSDRGGGVSIDRNGNARIEMSISPNPGKPESSRSSTSDFLREDRGDRGGPRNSGGQTGLPGPRSSLSTDTQILTSQAFKMAMNESSLERMQRLMNDPCFLNQGTCIRPMSNGQPESPRMFNPKTSVCFGIQTSMNPLVNEGMMRCDTDGRSEICTFGGISMPGKPLSVTVSACPEAQTNSICFGIGGSMKKIGGSADICFEQTPKSLDVRFGASP